MKVYQVWYDNGLIWSDHNRWTGGLYFSKSEAEKEIVDFGFIWNDSTESYVIDKVKWALEENREDDSRYDPYEYQPSDCWLDDFATIQEVEVLEKYVPEEEKE